MRKLLPYILFSLLIPVAAAVVFYSQFRSYSTDIDPNMQYLIRPSTERNDIVLIGSSMVWNLIDPITIEKTTGLRTYNLGLEGANIVYFNMVYQKYLQVHPRPACIVMNVDYRAFDTDHKMFNFPYYVPYLKDSLVSATLLPYYPQYRSGWEQWYSQIKLINSEPDNDKLANFMRLFRGAGETGNKASVDSARGFHPYDMKWENNSHRVDPFTPVCTPTGLNLLRDMIKDCRQKDIKLILVCGPLYKDYHHLVIDGERIFDSIQQIADESHTPYWRYSDCYMSQDTGYFYNFGHLNKKGAAIYSEILAHDLTAYFRDSSYVPEINY